MRIIIVGCGKVGSELAGQLSAAGHDLTLIDLSERRLEELSNTHDLDYGVINPDHMCPTILRPVILFGAHSNRKRKRLRRDFLPAHQ